MSWDPLWHRLRLEQGRAAICHAFGIPFEGTVDPSPVSAVYGMPEVSGAGLTEEQCRDKGFDYEVGRADLGLTPPGAIAGRTVATVMTSTGQHHTVFLLIKLDTR